MIKLSMMLLTVLLLASAAQASSVRIGNGDDGTDLEGAITISSGPIFEARLKAVANLKALNVQGIEGLGILIPEIEHTDILLATIDVQALSSEGTWESSGDRKKVYARTFAEPHAPTRFFPAALTLNQDQLIALHTHEALHRALPPEFREDEERVAILTMAITSPSATFDRVNLVARNILQTRSQSVATANSMSSSSTARAFVPETTPQKTRFAATHVTYALPVAQSAFENTERLSVEFSPIGVVNMGRNQAEPRLGLEAIATNQGRSEELRGGPLSAWSKLPFVFGSGMSAGPLVRVSLRPIEEPKYYDNPVTQRDVYSIGGFFEINRPFQVREVALTYSMPSSATVKFSDYGYGSDYGDGYDHGYDQEHGSYLTKSVKIGSIWSLTGREAFKWKRFQIGGNYELHHARSAYLQRDPVTILRAGPDLRWTYGRTTLAFSLGATLNRTSGSLNSLADVAGHGRGKNSATASLAVEI